MNQTDADDAKDCVVIRRRSDFPGVEIRTVERSAATWNAYSAEYELFIPHTWRGRVWHRRRCEMLEPGLVLCAHPGDVYRATNGHVTGLCSTLAIDANLLGAFVEERSISRVALSLRPVARMSVRFKEHLFEIHEALAPDKGPSEIKAALEALVATLVDEILDRRTAHRIGRTVVLSEQTAPRGRASPSGGEVEPLDLTMPSLPPGTSRYQVLRAFKRDHGLPPHAYRLHMRVGLAQRLLRAGDKPAQVALACGFVDQSHLTRSFKRIVGLTPSRYQRVGLSPPPARPLPPISSESDGAGFPSLT